MSPDGSTNPPPEERLLNLIRGKQRPAQAAAAQPMSATPEPAPSSASRIMTPQVIIPQLQLPWSTMLVWGLGGLLVAQLIWFTVQTSQSKDQVSLALPETIVIVPEAIAAGPLETPSLAESAPASLFQAQTSTTSSTATTPRGSPSLLGKELASRLSLMGLVAGNPPQAIIEDSQTKKSYFVTPGQTVVEGATLNSVSEHRAILDLNGEKIELSL